MKRKIKLVLIFSVLGLLAYLFNNCQDQNISQLNQSSLENDFEFEDPFCNEWDTETVCQIKRRNFEKSKQRELLELKLETRSPIRHFLNHDFTFSNTPFFEFNIAGTCNEGDFFDHIIEWKVNLVIPPNLRNDPNREVPNPSSDCSLIPDSSSVVFLCNSIGHDESKNKDKYLCVPKGQESNENYCENGRFFLRVRVPTSDLRSCLNCSGATDLHTCFGNTTDYFHLIIQFELISLTENSEKITYPLKTRKSLSIQIRQSLEPPPEEDPEGDDDNENGGDDD